MDKLPILNGIMKYIGESNVPFSMPGHKSGRGFITNDEGKKLYENLIRGDITEVDGLDNLHNADGIIKEAQKLLSDLYESTKSYFLVNGSTSGNLAMIFSTFAEGDKVIVERNCHRSIFNGIIMRKLKPIYIKSKINNTFNAPFSIDMEHFLKLIDEHNDARGIIITYPNYYGICSDLEKIIAEAKKREMKILVDSAHGAHFGISDRLPKSALKLGADMVVMSAHKTLPSLTQTAYLHVGGDVDTRNIDFFVSAFTSTSPSYMFLATLDYARFYLETEGRDGFEKCIRIANDYRLKINSLKKFHVITQSDVRTEHRDDNILLDESRYIINVEKGLSGHLLLDYLRKNSIQAEMSDQSNVVLIFSPFNTESDFEKLYEVLLNCPIDVLRDRYIPMELNNLPKAALTPYETMNKKKMKVKLDNAVGKVSGMNIVPYPPGVPIVMLGEILEQNAINMIKYYLDNNITVLGVEEQYIEVLDQEYIYK